MVDEDAAKSASMCPFFSLGESMVDEDAAKSASMCPFCCCCRVYSRRGKKNATQK
jgi:hypothetical protein